MPIVTTTSRYICPRCLRATLCATRQLGRNSLRYFVSTSSDHQAGDGSVNKPKLELEEPGALSRRLGQMSEEALETGGRAAQKAVEEAGFSEDLKRQLEERIAGSKFRSDNVSAVAQASLPTSVGRGTRDIAAATPWSGTESIEDATLRMLTDAHKPLRTPSKIPSPGGSPMRIDIGRTVKGSKSSGTRLANARDRSSVYASMKDSGMSQQERDQFLKEMKSRFQADARSVPATLQGLTSLANERIEDAIARGQFKNLPRGKEIVRDYNASSPFIDTTEYFLNKMIQKQEIVPPWIEKQQELMSAVHRFRARLRNDWKRHAARLIASKGGSLKDQVRRAEEYAAAEAVDNPPRVSEKTAVVGPDGTVHMSQISRSGDILIRPSRSEPKGLESEPPPDPKPQVVRQPFRDPTWEQTEHAYHSLTITELNNMTRSYNLMAPRIAQKPYYTLDRELRTAYADVAPQLAGEITERARAPTKRPLTPFGAGGHLAPMTGLLEGFGSMKIKVYDEDARKGYGLKEFWRDLWRR